MRFISFVSATVLACALAAAAAQQQPIRTGDITLRKLTAADFPRLTTLAANVYAYEQIDPTKRIVTANNLIVVSDDGVLVAEGQGTVDNVRRLVADIAKLTAQPIKYVVAGSEHPDHTGGDSAFPATATFLVHPSSKAAVERRVGRAVDLVSGERRTILMGRTEIDVLFLGRAHTGGDLEVFVPREKILFMSEVFSNRIFPSMANSFPGEWVETLKKAERMDASIMVPAHGFIDSAAVLKEEEMNYRLAVERVIAEGRRLHDAHVAVDLAADNADFGPYADWTRRSENAAGALKRVYMQLDGELR
jgi:glyoxylase-like metal-dependent hydrolase (beta-lactamase superfamily II)